MHALLEVLIGFVLAGGVFIASNVFFCLKLYRCDDMGGLVWLILSFLIAVIVLAVYMSLCRRYRHRYRARVRLDSAAAILAVIIWVAWFFLDRMRSIY
jgi:sterol desaturase/sphingolipid hydroxylase (fatty acid hydroxylase superfamily)